MPDWKTWAFLLVLALLVPVIPGCGGPDGGERTSQPSSSGQGPGFPTRPPQAREALPSGTAALSTAIRESTVARTPTPTVTARPFRADKSTAVSVANPEGSSTTGPTASTALPVTTPTPEPMPVSTRTPSISVPPTQIPVPTPLPTTPPTRVPISTPLPTTPPTRVPMSTPLPTTPPTPVPTSTPLPTTPPTRVPTPTPTVTATVAPTPTGGISSPPDPSPGPTPVMAAGCAEGQVDVNSAPAEKLEQIKHIGTSRAAQILELRPFTSLDGLTRISGIGEKRLAEIKDQGLACAGL